MAGKQQHTRSLSGIAVVDFGQQIAAPAVGMILADLGATVIHIDPPEGPLWDHPANAVLNRNKKCIRLDLKDPEQKQQALEMIALADVVIEGFRPSVMKKLGIDFEKLRQNRPELITLSTPGFASDDSLRNEWKATEAVVAATSGVFSDMGFNRVLMGLNPSFSPLPLGSAYATSLAASSVVMALYNRLKTGRGDQIEVPVVAALMEGLSYNSYVIDGLPERYKTMREKEIESRRENNIEMDLSYTDLQEYLDPFYRTYECADGRFFYCVCPSHRNHAKRALQQLGIYEELLEDGLPEVEDLYLPQDQWDGETSIGVYPLPKKWADHISAKMKKAFLTKTSLEWGEIFGEGQIPGAPHRTTQEWIHDEHSLKSGLIIPVEDQEYGTMLQPGPVAWLECCAEQIIKAKGRENISPEKAMAELKPLAEARSLPKPSANDKPWLDGVRVLDLTNVIAGPHSASFLSRFGAEIIKVDTVKPMYDPLIGVYFTFLCNIGKKSLLLDIMSDKGRTAFNKLLKKVDIVVINAPERQIKPLGLDAKSLAAVNPRVIFCRLDCFGGPLRGPKTDYIGYDDIIQANSGIMSRFGGPKTPEEHAHLGTLDVNCGFAAGLGMGLALYEREKTGTITRPRTSLSAVTNLTQIPFAFDYAQRGPFNEPSGREALGNNSLSHFYETQDGWIFLDSNNKELAKLESIEGLEQIGKATDQKAYLQEQLAKQTTNTWLTKLRSKDIACATSLNIAQLREEYQRIEDGKIGKGSYAFSIYPKHPSEHCVTVIDHYSIRPKEAPIVRADPAERFGASSYKILADLGYNNAEIEGMIADKVAALGWSTEYLPSDSKKKI